MKKKILRYILLTFICLYVYNNFFLTSMIVGTYTNKNYSSSSHYVEVPSVFDKLVLFDDNTFESSFYGEGKYNLIQDLNGTTIELVYSQNGRNVFITKISRVRYGKPKIILVMDLNQWYEKD